MSLKLQIETAKDAVSKALITSLENKQETVVGELFRIYDKLNNLKFEEQVSFTFSSMNTVPVKYYDSSSVNNLFSSMSNDIISF